jgi:hypothetical protein
MECHYCSETARLKEKTSQRAFCGTKCQQLFYIGMKRSRSYEEEEFEEMGMFLAIVRASGKCNMITEQQCIYTTLICLFGYYSKPDYIKYIMNHIKEYRNISGILEKYWYKSETRNLDFEKAKATPPYGIDYIEKYKNFKGKKNEKLDKLIDYMEQNEILLSDRTWAEGIVAIAHELCYEKGVYARDVLRIKELKYDMDELKIYGAQLLANE